MSTLHERACAFALDRHDGQRYGDQPYSAHLEDVDTLLGRYGFDAAAIRAAGWLHDVVEDGHATSDEIEEQFGPTVARLVDAVTGVGANRRARNASIVEKLRASRDAVPVKLADRLANVAYCWRARSPLLFMYYREHPTFRDALRPLSGDPRVRQMWVDLDALLGRRVDDGAPTE